MERTACYVEAKVGVLRILYSSESIGMGFRFWNLHEYPLLQTTTKHIWLIKAAAQLEKPRYVRYEIRDLLCKRPERTLLLLTFVSIRRSESRLWSTQICRTLRYVRKVSRILLPIRKTAARYHGLSTSSSVLRKTNLWRLRRLTRESILNVEITCLQTSPHTV